MDWYSFNWYYVVSLGKLMCANCKGRDSFLFMISSLYPEFTVCIRCSILICLIDLNLEKHRILLKVIFLSSCWVSVMLYLELRIMNSTGCQNYMHYCIFAMCIGIISIEIPVRTSYWYSVCLLLWVWMYSKINKQK